MIFNLLDSVLESGDQGGGNFPWFWVGLGLLLLVMIIMNAVGNKKRREQIEEEKKKRGAIEPGFKVTTIGGIMGTVVEVDHEANTFVLQTGSAEYPCYLKFDKVAIYSSEDPNAPVEEVEEDLFEGEVVENAEEVVNETVETSVDEESDTEVLEETSTNKDAD